MTYDGQTEIGYGSTARHAHIEATICGGRLVINSTHEGGAWLSARSVIDLEDAR